VLEFAAAFNPDRRLLGVIDFRSKASKRLAKNVKVSKPDILLDFVCIENFVEAKIFSHETPYPQRFSNKIDGKNITPASGLNEVR